MSLLLTIAAVATAKMSVGATILPANPTQRQLYIARREREISAAAQAQTLSRARANAASPNGIPSDLAKKCAMYLPACF